MASRPGKYSAVVGHLPKLDTIEPERRDLMNGVKAQILIPPTERESQDHNLGVQIQSHLKRIGDLVNVTLTIAKRNAAGRQHAAGFAAAYADARAVLDAIGDWKSSTQLLVDAYESLMLERMETEGVASLRLETGASVSTSSEPYGKVVDKEAFRLWCIANGYEGQLQLWPSSMNALTKERVLAGTAAPDGVEVTVKVQVRLNKA